ncbi:MAG: LuxR family transcriptional regulator [Nakamurella sp.]
MRPTTSSKPTGALGIIRALLDEMADGGGALVLSGESGVGKTRLLDVAECAASAIGMRVVRAGGAEFEADIGFAGLHQLLLPLFAEISDLPGIAASALDAALGLAEEGRTPERLVVLNAVLSLLRHAAREAPLLLIVDDLQWFDPASREALGFVARRFAGSRIGLLGAVRVGSESLLQRVGLPELRLRRPDSARPLAGSRDKLAAAHDTVTRIGARPWDERAGVELRATGRRRHRTGGGVALLTCAEVGIAELAATGLTNKEIGGRLYVSPRTVSAHLYRIFPKLGITSRAGLRDALCALPAAATLPQT